MKTSYTLSQKIIFVVCFLILLLASFFHVFLPDNTKTPELFPQDPEFFKVNLNSASEKELLLLPYISEEIAQQIIEYRIQNGGIHSSDELLHIKGIGPFRLKKIEAYIKLE